MKDKYGSTPLHVAAGCGHREVAELLISKGADVNAKDDIGQTPLHCVSTKEIAELLISKGADVNAKDSRGWTPLFSAIKRSNKIIGELLRERGAKK